MGANSRIEWTDATVNFWFGCTKLTAACDNCHAEGWAKRSGMVENEKTAAMRLPDLATIAMAGWKTFISYEPAPGLVNWGKWFAENPGLFQWLICGGESGGHARPMNPEWARWAARWVAQVVAHA